MKIHHGLVGLLGISVNAVLTNSTPQNTTLLNTTVCSDNATVQAAVSIQHFAVAVTSTQKTTSTRKKTSSTTHKSTTTSTSRRISSTTHKSTTTSASKRTSSTTHKSTTKSTSKRTSSTTHKSTTTSKKASTSSTKKSATTSTKKSTTTAKKTTSIPTKRTSSTTKHATTSKVSTTSKTTTKPTTTKRSTTTKTPTTLTKPTSTTKPASTTTKTTTTFKSTSLSTTTNGKPSTSTTTSTTTTKPTTLSTTTTTTTKPATSSTSTISTSSITSSSASPTASYSCSPPINADISPWVGCSNGQLTYGTFGPGNDQIPDFSNVGYKGGAVPIPNPVAQVMLSPSSSGDDTIAVQSALNEVGQLPIGNDGFRGAVLLLPGTFVFTNCLYISSSGVVLRGSGTGQTLLNLTFVLNSTSVNNSFITADGGSYYKFSNRNTTITDQYVPVHTTLLNVTDASKFVVGDKILVQRRITSDWVNFMGMQNLQKTINGTSVSWYSNSSRSFSTQERTVIGISNNTLQLDIPLTDPYNATLDGNSTVNAFTIPGRLINIGIESLSAIAPPSQSSQDINVNVTNFDNGLCDMDHISTRLTIQDIDIQHGVPLNLTQGHALELIQRGQQSLYQRIRDTGYSIYFHTTQSYTNGPNVIRDCIFNAPSGSAATSLVAPHNRFATGALFENITFTNGGIQIINRKADGSGQGWAAAWSVGWNSIGSTFQIYTPPGSTNWCIGCQGPHKGNGTFYSSTANVWPESLYLEQLKARLGQNATPT